jgi:hypothetical protein
MKKKGYNMKKLELERSETIKSLEKNPTKGGTPDIEKIAKINIRASMFKDPNSMKEYKVL